jgi:hypothetical protein
LNAPLAPSNADLSLVPGFTFEFWVKMLPGATSEDGVALFVSKATAPFKDAAKIELINGNIGKTIPDIPDKVRAAFFVMQGHGPVEIRLDGMFLKHVTIRDVTISYEGGPVILDDVYFVNCTFDVRHAPNSQELATAILEHSPTTFRQS